MEQLCANLAADAVSPSAKAVLRGQSEAQTARARETRSSGSQGKGWGQANIWPRELMASGKRSLALWRREKNDPLLVLI